MEDSMFANMTRLLKIAEEDEAYQAWLSQFTEEHMNAVEVIDAANDIYGAAVFDGKVAELTATFLKLYFLALLFPFHKLGSGTEENVAR